MRRAGPPVELVLVIAPGTLRRTVLSVPKMDCPTEVSLIRLALDRADGSATLEVDLDARRITVTHQLEDAAVLRALRPLGFGAELLTSEATDVRPGKSAAATRLERRALLQVLAINASMFVIEFAVGWLADSTGLLADSLDMFADASVYLVSLYAVTRSSTLQHRAALLGGATQLLLAVGLLVEVLRRALLGSEPASGAMMLMALVALFANLGCVWILRRHRDGGAHMQASWIFTTSDALANAGVILAGGLVWSTGSRVPDLVIGALIGGVVLRSAIRILRLPAAKDAKAS